MQSKNVAALKRALTGSAKRRLPSTERAAGSRRRQAVRAIKGKDAEALARLLALGVSPDLCCGDGPLLRIAVATNFPAGVRALLAAGADPEASWPACPHAGGPLCISAVLAAAECMEMLLTAGADPDGGPSMFGSPRMPPAVQAIISGNWRALRLLGEAGADMRKANCHGYDILSQAVAGAQAQDDASGVRICLEFGADPNRLSGPLRENAPMLALRRSWEVAMRALCEHGFDPSLGDGTGGVAEKAKDMVGPAAEVLRAWLLSREESIALNGAAGLGSDASPKPRL